jgi:integrase
MGLVKRGNVWWMSFMYQGRQVRRSTGTPDKRLADAILSKIKTEIIEGRYFNILEEQKRTFNELMDRFKEEHVPKKASQRSYHGYIKRLRPFFGPMTLAEITPRVIVQYKNKRYADKVSPATINRELAVMKKAFNLARKEWEWCRDNPVSRVSLEKENNQRDRWLTHEEEERLLAACLPWVKQIVVFALNTGMRMGEILALTWAGADLFRRTVTVFRSKNGERRTIPVNHTVLELLKEKARGRSLDQDLVFCSQAGTMVDHNNLRRAFRAAMGKAKIADFHFHDLRHTFATRLTQGGIDLYKVQRLLGHKSPIMTQRYAHHYPESLRDGVDYLDRAKAVSTISAQSAGLAGGTGS